MAILKMQLGIVNQLTLTFSDAEHLFMCLLAICIKWVNFMICEMLLNILVFEINVCCHYMPMLPIS